MRVLLAAALFAIAVGATSRAADAECLLDHCEDQRSPPSPTHVDQSNRGGDGSFRRNGSGPRGASTPGQFDFYVLSLSWSPGFCATGGDEKGRDQCRTGANLGFVVHGLWPQYDHGFPSDCAGNTFPPRAALAQTDGVYPDQGLARYEWRKHGTCSGLSPFAYFAAAKAARDAVTIPALYKDDHVARTQAPADVTRAFTEANPTLRPGMLAAICQRGTLDEVRICFSRDLKHFQACPEVVREGCRSGSVAVPPER